MPNSLVTITNEEKVLSSSMPSNTLYITKVLYNEPKSEILLEFSNASQRIVQRHKFFPFIIFSETIPQEKLTDLVLSLGFKGFNITQKDGLFLLYASSFSELKKISNSIALHINKKPLVLEPERAFLLEKGWSYFSAFERVGSNLILINSPGQSSSGSSFSVSEEKDLGFFLTKEIPFSHALKLSEEDALFLVTQAAWAEILCVPISTVPRLKEEKTELFQKQAEPIID